MELLKPSLNNLKKTLEPHSKSSSKLSQPEGCQTPY